MLGNTDVLLSGMAAAASQIRASISDAAEEAMKADEVDGGAAAEPTLVFSLRASSQRERSRSRSRSRREPRGSVTSEVSAAEASTAAAAADVEAPPPPLPAAPSTVAEGVEEEEEEEEEEVTFPLELRELDVEADEESEDGQHCWAGLASEQWMVRGPQVERTLPPGSTHPL